MRTQVATMARNPRTTMTAMAQCGKLDPLSCCKPPAPDDVVETPGVEAVAAWEADTEATDRVEATDADDMAATDVAEAAATDETDARDDVTESA